MSIKPVTLQPSRNREKHAGFDDDPVSKALRLDVDDVAQLLPPPTPPSYTYSNDTPVSEEGDICSYSDSGQDFIERDEALDRREEGVLDLLAKINRLFFQLVGILNQILSDRIKTRFREQM